MEVGGVWLRHITNKNSYWSFIGDEQNKEQDEDMTAGLQNDIMCRDKIEVIIEEHEDVSRVAEGHAKICEDGTKVEDYEDMTTVVVEVCEEEKTAATMNAIVNEEKNTEEYEIMNAIVKEEKNAEEYEIMNAIVKEEKKVKDYENMNASVEPCEDEKTVIEYENVLRNEADSEGYEVMDGQGKYHDEPHHPGNDDKTIIGKL